MCLRGALVQILSRMKSHVKKNILLVAFPIADRKLCCRKHKRAGRSVGWKEEKLNESFYFRGIPSQCFVFYECATSIFT